MDVTGLPTSRAGALKADRVDPLGPYRDQFVVTEGPIYLDGNSLGRQPRAAAPVIEALLQEWATDLVGGWHRWADLPQVVGDRIGQLVGAAPGQVVVSDSTTVNLYKLAISALDARAVSEASGRHGRRAIIGDAHDFPTVRYVLQGLAAREGCELRLITSDPRECVPVASLLEVLDDDVALVCLSAVNYRSGAVVDMASVTEAAHRAGALVLWDLSHAAGVLPLQLDADGADLAVGCGYKYLNGGPGAPAWLYVSATLAAQLCQPIWGWWGQRHQFLMDERYDPVPGVGRFLAGTPDILGLTALNAGLEPLVAAGIPAIWSKTHRLVGLLLSRAEELLVPLGATIASPGDAGRRGGHLAVAHPDAWTATQLLIGRRLVVPDFRPPDVLRLAPVAIYTTYCEVWDAVDRVASVLADPAVRAPMPRKRVT